MSDIADVPGSVAAGPVFVAVMGCSGSGKTAWTHANHERLPVFVDDGDGFAGENLDEGIARVLGGGSSFGARVTFADGRGPGLLSRAAAAGYRVEGYYLGTESWHVNARRLEAAPGRRAVESSVLRDEYLESLSNLCRHARTFDRLEVADNSAEAAYGLPDPRVQFTVERGRLSGRVPAAEMAWWCGDLLPRLALW